jgi:hypothetical protein
MDNHVILSRGWAIQAYNEDGKWMERGFRDNVTKRYYHELHATQAEALEEMKKLRKTLNFKFRLKYHSSNPGLPIGDFRVYKDEDKYEL